MAIVKIQIRRKTASEWLNTNPTILPGEMGFELDTGRLKIGRETTEHWNDIPYVSTPFTLKTLSEIDVSDMNDFGNTSGQVELDVNQYSHFVLNIVGNTSLSVSEISNEKKTKRFTLKITDSYGSPITWPANFLWKDGIEPTFSSEVSLLGFFSDDGGITWINESNISNLRRKGT